MNVLYLSIDGMMEPLGQSQVLAYLRLLARDHRFTILSLEKPRDLARKEAVATLKADCRSAGIDWVPLTYHHRPRLIAKMIDLPLMLIVALWLISTHNIALVHARSYIPTFVALILKAFTGVPFIFDMRALWVDELLVAGRLKADSALSRLARRGEASALRRAAAVVSLTHAAVTYLKKLEPELEKQDFSVIPTCVDLAHFTPGKQKPDMVMGSVGTIVSGWFKLDWLMALFAAVRRRDPAAKLRVITRDDQAVILAAAGRGGAGTLSIESAPPADIVAEIRSMQAVGMFFDEGLAKLGSCPTRMGEVLACGIPVVGNAGIGDVAEIVNRYNVGVLAEGASPAEMDRALEALAVLKADPMLPARCRHAADDWFSLTKGADAYAAIYQRIESLSRDRGVL